MLDINYTVLPIPCSPYRTPHNPVDLEAKSRQSGCHRLTQEIAGNYKILFNFAVNFHNPFSHAYRRIRTAEFWVMRTPQTPYQQVCKRFRAPHCMRILLHSIFASPGLPLAGLEPATPCLEGRCANHCATKANYRSPYCQEWDLNPRSIRNRT